MQVFVEQERDTFETDDGGRSFHRTLLEVRVFHGDETTMEEDLLAVLVADAGVAAQLVDRIAWNARPQGEALPNASLHRITGTSDYHMQGASGLVDSLVQIDCWAETWLAAKLSARAVKAALLPLSQPRA